MEVILSTAFGVQRDVQTDQDEPYTPNAALLFRQPAVSISLSKYSNDSMCRAVLTDYSHSHVSPHVRESGFRNPGIFCLWNPESWALESGIQH